FFENNHQTDPWSRIECRLCITSHHRRPDDKPTILALTSPGVHYMLTIVLALNVVSPRTRMIASSLGAELTVLKSKPPYVLLLPLLTVLLKRKRPGQVIIELPAGPLLLAVTIAKFLGLVNRVVADVHTGFLSGLALSKH